MNVNQIVNMIFRMVLRRAVNKGINAGMKRVGKARRNKQQQDRRPRG